jgi:hypothetical protein
MIFLVVMALTKYRDRTPAFGQAMAAIFLALTTGPLVSMFTTPAVAFRLACLFTIINCFYIIFILPESPATLAGARRAHGHGHGHGGPATGNINGLHIKTTATTPLPPQYGTFDRSKSSNELNVPSTPTRTGGASGGGLHLDLTPRPSPDASPPPTAGGSVRRAAVPLTPALLPHTGVGSTAMLPSSNPRARAEPRTLNPLRALKFALRDPLYTSITLIVFFSQLSEYGVFEVTIPTQPCLFFLDTNRMLHCVYYLRCG